MLERVKTIAIFALSAVVLAGGAYSLFAKREQAPEAVQAKPSPIVAKAPVKRVAVKAPIRTYQGETKANLRLPAEVVADPVKQVVSASTVAPDLHRQTVSAVLNTETGEVETFVKPEPYPWLAPEGRGYASLAYGYKGSGVAVKPVGRLTVGYDVVRVKALTIGAVASADTDRTAFVGLQLTYRW